MTNLLSRWTEFAAPALRIFGTLLLAFIFIRLLKSFTNRLVQKAGAEAANRAARMREQQTQTFAGVLYSGGVVIIIAIAILMALSELRFDIRPIAAAAGLASLALGIGAQGMVRDFINGFFIVFEDQFVVGDTVRVGDVTGRVEHITLRRTVIRDMLGAIITMPNGQIQQVANLSRDWSQVFLDVTIAPDCPLDPPLAVLDRVAAGFRADAAWSAALVDVPRVLGVDSIGSRGSKILIQVRTAPTRQDDVARELRRRISAQFEKEGIRTGGVQQVEVRYAANLDKENSDGTSQS